MTAPVFPISRVLVPRQAPALPTALAPENRSLTQGLPERLSLDASASLVVVVPQGLATAWRDADPTDVVTASAPELLPTTRHASDPVAGVVRAPAQLLVLLGGVLAGAVSLGVGLHARVVPAAGNGLELVVTGWTIAAGSMRGAGDFGSSIQFGWRRLGAGSAEFQPPALDPRVAQRLRRRFRLESELGPEPQRAKLARAL